MTVIDKRVSYLHFRWVESITVGRNFKIENYDKSLP